LLCEVDLVKGCVAVSLHTTKSSVGGKCARNKQRMSMLHGTYGIARRDV